MLIWSHRPTLITAPFDQTDKLTAADQMSFLPAVSTNRQSAIMFRETQYSSSGPWTPKLIKSGWMLRLTLLYIWKPSKKGYIWSRKKKYFLRMVQFSQKLGWGIFSKVYFCVVYPTYASSKFYKFILWAVLLHMLLLHMALHLTNSEVKMLLDGKNTIDWYLKVFWSIGWRTSVFICGHKS